MHIKILSFIYGFETAYTLRHPFLCRTKCKLIRIKISRTNKHIRQQNEIICFFFHAHKQAHDNEEEICNLHLNPKQNHSKLKNIFK